MHAESPSTPSVRLDGEEADSTIDGYELFAARRALALLKDKLGRDRTLDLLADEIAAGEAFLRDHLARSSGEEATGTTSLRTHGISAGEFTGWLARAFAREEVMLAANPEHYAIHAEPGADVNIVETLGDQVCSFFMRPYDESVIVDQALPTGRSAARRSRMLLPDGTVIGSIANAFDEEEDGFTTRLSVTLPATCAPDVINQHLEHFAVEFRTWILRAASELATTAESA